MVRMIFLNHSDDKAGTLTLYIGSGHTQTLYFTQREEQEFNKVRRFMKEYYHAAT